MYKYIQRWVKDKIKDKNKDKIKDKEQQTPHSKEIVYTSKNICSQINKPTQFIKNF